jgi:hypothetical protein
LSEGGRVALAALVRAVPGVLACDIGPTGQLVVLTAPDADQPATARAVHDLAGPRAVTLLAPTPIRASRADERSDTALRDLLHRRDVREDARPHRRRVKVAAVVVCAAVPVGAGVAYQANRPRVIEPHVAGPPPASLAVHPRGVVTIVPPTTTSTTTTTFVIPPGITPGLDPRVAELFPPTTVVTGP